MFTTMKFALKGFINFALHVNNYEICTKMFDEICTTCKQL